MIGPYDLSASLGKPGRFEDPDVVAALDRYETICRAAGKPMGYHVIESTAAAAHARIARGYAFVAFSTDALFLGNTCRGELARLRDAIGADAPPRS
jgi:2-dehydro-3-deoxyglucarate aldolase